MLRRYRLAAGLALRSASQLQSIGHPVGAARSTFAAGQALFFAGQYEEAKLLLERAVEAARSLECSRLSGHALLSLARTQAALGDAAAADAMSAQARLAYERCGSVTGLGHASFDRAEQAFRAGDAETAVRRVMRALAIYRSREDDYVCGLALSNAAAYLTELERFREAFACASEALRLGRATKSLASVCALLHLTAIAALVPNTMADGQREHRLRHAASLLGYVEERFRLVGSEPEYTEKHAFDRIRATLDAAIAPPELAALLARGAAYTEDEACELALSLEFVDPLLPEAPTSSTYARNGT